MIKKENNTELMIEIDIKEFDKIDSENDVIFIKKNSDDTETLIDKNFNRLSLYHFDYIGRCYKKIIYEISFDFQYPNQDNDNFIFIYNTTIIYKFDGNNIYPSLIEFDDFFIKNTYDNQKLISSKTSKDDVLLISYNNDITRKTYYIKNTFDGTRKTYNFIFKNNKLIEYNDSNSNYWHCYLCFDNPYKKIEEVELQFNNNNKFY